jgi:20S proteasome alpha/beta subunit
MVRLPRRLVHHTEPSAAEPRRGKRMTVCIAAVCHWPGPSGTPGRVIVGASDRMITANDVQYEPNQMKVHALGQKVAVLFSGEYVVHAEISAKTAEQITKHNLTSVSEIADLYGRNVADYRMRCATTAYLRPIGLDENTFIARQATMERENVADLIHKMQNFKLEYDAIITGMDDAHISIYCIDYRGMVYRQDTLGYAAIGIGKEPAESEFRFAKYEQSWPFARALLLTYSAKRRAESAPGIGQATDMFAIYGTGAVMIADNIVQRVRKIYEAKEKAKNKAENRGLVEMEKFVSEIYDKPAPAPTSSVLVSSPTATSDGR